MGTLNVDNLKYLGEIWFEPKGLITVLILANIFLLTSLDVSLQFYIIFAGSNAIILLSWWLSTKPQTTKKGKIGFLVCLDCSEDKEARKVTEDFIKPLKKLVSDSDIGEKFDFIVAPQRIARNVTGQKEAEALRKKCRAHFMIYGDVRLRFINGKEHHVTELNGLVIHRITTQENSAEISREFSTLLPRNLNIEAENDHLSFQFTSSWAAIVAHYIIGLAYSFSGDLEHATSMYSRSFEMLKGMDSSFPIYSILKKRIPNRIADIHRAYSESAYNAWEADKTDENFRNFLDRLAKVDDTSRKLPPSDANLKAIAVFLDKDDALDALRILKKSRVKDALWKFNVAFLHAYMGNIDLATKLYREASKTALAPDVIGKIEDFISLVLDRNPKKIQLHYLLGLFNKLVKGDKVSALQDLNEFIRKCPPAKFEKQLIDAQRMVSGLTK